MESSSPFDQLVGRALASALEKRGFTALMPVQLAMLAPELAGRDIRMSSQTGSGKTVAIGLAIRELAAEPTPAVKGIARPRALVVVPTRELAKQVDEELTWLYAPLHARVASATGGANIRDERRAFAAGPAVVVGTPGRLLDHLNRGSIDASGLGAVVLDEADRMLDLGFRDELEAILKHAPPGHRTHLVSATFPRDVLSLANRVQTDPVHIEGTPLGTANADIDHLVHLVAQHDRVSAIINLLLATPGAQTLVFARTRADVAQITSELAEAGFDVRALSGEMEQGERNRALAAFKRGTLHALVATDVAARGIDVQDIARVVHAEPPTDADSYTHRSGRTGRAGRKGTSSVMVSPAGLARVSQLLRRAGVRYRVEPIPTAADIRRAADERILADLTAEEEPGSGAAEDDPRFSQIAEKLASTGDVTRTIARLLARAHVAGGPQPREVRAMPAPIERERPVRPARPADGPSQRPPEPEGGWVPFRFTWGKEHGADPRRLVAMACRRGGIRSGDIGAIFVARTHSIVNIASPVAASFARSASEHDPRDPRVTIRPEGETRDTRPAPPRHHEPRPQEPRHASRPHEPRPREPRPREPRSHAPQAHEPRPHTSRPQHPRSPDPRPHAPRPDVPKPLPSRPRPPGPRRHVTHERPSQSGGERRPERPKR
ncbi:MAG: DEAD/DEAH box helicase [Polyangiaceae bacterium]